MVKQGSTQQSEQLAWIQGQSIEQLLALINMNFSILTRKISTSQGGVTDQPGAASLPTGIIRNITITTGTDHETTQFKDTYLEFEWDNIGINYAYDIHIRKANTTNKWRKNAIPPDDETRVSIRIGNLRPGRWYEFRIRARSSFNTMSGWVTGEYQTALDIPEHIHFIVAGGGDAQCNWNHQYPWLLWEEIADETDIEFYEVRVADIDWGVKNATFVHRTLEGFLEVASYYKKWSDVSKTFYVKARNKSGQWASVADSVTLTIATPTMAGFSPVVLSLSNKWRRVRWGTWTGYDSPNIKKYEIWYSTNPAFDAIDSDGSAIRDARVGPEANVHTIQDVDLVTTYYVRVKPIGWLEAGVQSEVVTSAP